MLASVRRSAAAPLIALFSALPASAGSAAHEREPAVAWLAWTTSPRPFAPEGDREARDRLSELLARCGRGEAGLAEVAQRVALNRATGGSHLDLDGLTFALRAAGEPHVWPHAWMVTGRSLDRGAIAAKLEAWGATFGDGGDRRCGVATGVAGDGSEIIAAVALDALADLAPLPTQAHVGSWLTVDARLLVPVAEAHVVVQGPGTDPRSIPSYMQEAGGAMHVRARFAPDRPGAFTVQIVADVTTGPRPILEARVFADVDPPEHFDAAGAPGENGAPATGSEADRLLAMVAGLRGVEGLPPLTRDPRLDAVALAHVRLMLAARTVGHDVGDGDPADRVEKAGTHARLVGENVAHAASVRLAHRALYESPSHRENLLRSEFDRAGAAVLDDADGSVWVAEVFAAEAR
jgi:uncharacterized protein YkwD